MTMRIWRDGIQVSPEGEHTPEPDVVPIDFDWPTDEQVIAAATGTGPSLTREQFRVWLKAQKGDAWREGRASRHVEGGAANPYNVTRSQL